MINIISTIFGYIKLLFGIEVAVLFIFVGLFSLIWDVPLLKKKGLERESVVIRVLGYVYIFGSIILFIIIKLK
ncbi:MAG TPA: CLC_0170 family protein [Clostridia bacterium]|nr:CLC_0170 family protein [Clostridia bacterium]